MPEGDINTFMGYLIHAVIEKIVKDIDLYYSNELENKVGYEPFNIKTLIYTIQFLIRESPSLVPWVAKYKCRKVIQNIFKNYAFKSGKTS